MMYAKELYDARLAHAAIQYENDLAYENGGVSNAYAIMEEKRLLDLVRQASDRLERAIRDNRIPRITRHFDNIAEAAAYLEARR